MIWKDPGSDKLAARFRELPVEAEFGEDCFVAERILETVLGRAPKAEARALASHAAACAACALAWRLAREFAAESGLHQPAGARIRWHSMGMAAALVVVAVVGAWWVGREAWRPPAEPVYRAGSQETVHSLVGDAPLPVDAFVLRWSADQEGSRYDLRVTDRRLNLIAEGRSLTATEYTVPREALADLEPGESVLWQVEIHRPDGRKLDSSTFTARLE